MSANFTKIDTNLPEKSQFSYQVSPGLKTARANRSSLESNKPRRF
jgi:hypothetical protein